MTQLSAWHVTDHHPDHYPDGASEYFPVVTGGTVAVVYVAAAWSTMWRAVRRKLPFDSVVRSRHYDGDAPAWSTSGRAGAGSTRILFPGGILRTYPTGIDVVFELRSRSRRHSRPV
jgi:hypothetical protein